MDDSISSGNTERSHYSRETVTTSETDSVATERNNKLIAAIANILNEIITENKQNCSHNSIAKDIFYSNRIPTLNLEDYIKRILKYSQMDPASLIIAIIYIDRICDNHKYILCINNIHRLLLAAVLLSVKFNEDDCYKNSYYAKVGGISLEEMNDLEYECFVKLNFSLYVELGFYQKYEIYFNNYTKSSMTDESDC
jgi:hypothetical protein